LPYLPGELIDLYRDAAVFEVQKEEIRRILTGMAK
jgi:hypothetical protein